MATAIEWTDETVNPIRARNIDTGAVGHYCEKISPGCQNCYASAWNERVRPSGKHLIGTGLAFDVRNRPKIETFLDTSKLDEVLRRRKPTKFFWCDMTDMFGHWVPDEMIDECFAVMAWTPQHTHQILTKRADRMRAYFAGDWHRRVVAIYIAMRESGRVSIPRDYDAQYACGQAFGSLTCGSHKSRFLPHVWLGVSVESRPYLTRLDHLFETPAAVRFVSLEPELEDLGDIGEYLDGGHESNGPAGWIPGPSIDWGIVGFESGRGARPGDIAWLRRVVAQFKAAGRPIFVKQLGAVPVMDETEWRGLSPTPLLSHTNHRRAPDGTVPLKLYHPKGGNPDEWPLDLRVREFPGHIPCHT